MIVDFLFPDTGRESSHYVSNPAEIYWNILVIGCNSLHYSGFNIVRLDFRSERVLLRQGQCSNSKQPLPAAELGFTLPSCVVFPLRAVWLLDMSPSITIRTGTESSLQLFLSLHQSLSLSLVFVQSFPQKHKHTSNTQLRPCPSPLGSSRWATDRIGWNKKEQKGKGCLQRGEGKRGLGCYLLWVESFCFEEGWFSSICPVPLPYLVIRQLAGAAALSPT